MKSLFSGISSLTGVLAGLLLFTACTTYGPYIDEGYKADWGSKESPQFSVSESTANVRILVLSDIHGYNAEVLVKSERALAFHNIFWKKNQDTDFKNTELILSTILPESEIDFVLLPGDLTVDGEKASHQQLASILSRFEESGIPVYVTPGNHDVNSPQAHQHLRSGSKPALSVSPAQFTRIYSDFGYREALSRDSVSLSYAVEPVPGLVLLVLDTAKWYENVFFPYRLSATGGAIRKSTLLWIETVLKAAHEAGKRIIAVQHHPLDDGVRIALGNSKKATALFNQYGVEAMIAGHLHRYRENRADSIHRINAPSVGGSPANILLIELIDDNIAVQLNPFNFGVEQNAIPNPLPAPEADINPASQ